MNQSIKNFKQALSYLFGAFKPAMTKEAFIAKRGAVHLLAYFSALCVAFHFLPTGFSKQYDWYLIGIALAAGLMSAGANFGLEWIQKVVFGGEFSKTDNVWSGIAGALWVLLYPILPDETIQVAPVLLAALIWTMFDGRRKVVKYFFLSLSSRFLFKRHGSVPRAVWVILPMMIINGVVVALNGEPNLSLLTALTIALYYGFVYPRVFPLQFKDWKNLTEFQKWQYGQKVYNQPDFNYKLEWQEIDKKVADWLKSKRLLY